MATGLKYFDLDKVYVPPIVRVIGEDTRAEAVQHIIYLTQGENMPRLECPKCKEELNEIIRIIEIRCRYDEEDDDYLNETDGDRFVDLCPRCKTELATF